MKKLSMVVMSLAVIGACNKKNENKAPPPAESKTTEQTKPAEPKPAEPAKPPTGEERAARYVEFMTTWSTHDEAKVKAFMAPDVTLDQVDSGQPVANGPDAALAHAKGLWAAFSDMKSEPQLVLVNGQTVVSVDWIHGTHNGELMGIPASNKKVGMLIAHVAEINDKREIAKISGYVDMSTAMGQIGVSPAPHRAALEKGIADKPTIIVAKDSPDEQANVAVTKTGLDGVNAHSIEKFQASLSDDSMESDQTSPADIKGKADLGKHVKQFFTAFPDVKLTVDKAVAVGDYVVNVGTFTGTNTADMKEWGLKKTGKAVTIKYIEVMKVGGGKITETWRFWNSMAMGMQLGLIPPPDAKKGDAKAPDAKGAKPADKPADKK